MNKTVKQQKAYESPRLMIFEVSKSRCIVASVTGSNGSFEGDDNSQNEGLTPINQGDF